MSQHPSSLLVLRAWGYGGFAGHKPSLIAHAEIGRAHLDRLADVVGGVSDLREGGELLRRAGADEGLFTFSRLVDTEDDRALMPHAPAIARCLAPRDGSHSWRIGGDADRREIETRWRQVGIVDQWTSIQDGLSGKLIRWSGSDIDQRRIFVSGRLGEAGIRYLRARFLGPDERQAELVRLARDPGAQADLLNFLEDDAGECGARPLPPDALVHLLGSGDPDVRRRALDLAGMVSGQAPAGVTVGCQAKNPV